MLHLNTAVTAETG